MVDDKKCALCRETKQLIDSHVISKFIYKYINKFNTRTISTYDGRAAYLGVQLKRPLLCKGCEDLIGVWEKHFSDNVLHKSKDIFNNPNIGLGVSDDANIAIDYSHSQKLTLFCLSILWRLSIFDKQFRLGPYEEKIRKYIIDTNTNTKRPAIDSVSIAASYASNIIDQDLHFSYQAPVRNKSGEHIALLVVMRLEFIITIGRPYIPPSKNIDLTPLPNIFVNTGNYLSTKYTANRLKDTEVVGKLKLNRSKVE